MVNVVASEFSTEFGLETFILIGITDFCSLIYLDMISLILERVLFPGLLLPAIAAVFYAKIYKASFCSFLSVWSLAVLRSTRRNYEDILVASLLSVTPSAGLLSAVLSLNMVGFKGGGVVAN